MSPVIFFLLALFVGLALAGLLVPVRLQVILNSRRRFAAIRWLAFAAGGDWKTRTFELRLLSHTVFRRRFRRKEGNGSKKAQGKPEEKEIERKTVKELKKTQKKSKRMGPIDYWHTRNLWRRLVQAALKFLWDVLRAVRWDRLDLDLNLATPDPALTGILFGQLCAVKYSAGFLFSEAKLTIRPDFVNQSSRASGETALSIRPLNAVLPLSRMFFAVPKIQIIKIFVLKKRR